jgi:hypothetical protein
MYRRRPRPRREVAFSFDSFLDLVTNVVGIIIRFILIAWVGARAYGTLIHRATVEETPAPALSVPQPADDPLFPQLAKLRTDLERAKRHLLDHLKELDLASEQQEQTGRELAEVAREKHALEQESRILDQALAKQGQSIQQAALSVDELRERGRRLADEIKTLEKQPERRKVLRYRTPVSRPVYSEELHFECKAGRVTFIDVPAFLSEVRRGLEDKAQRLRSQWQVSDTTGPIGAFRLRYTIERERDGIEGMLSSGAPPAQGNFHYGLSGWEVEPIALQRGETAEEALAENSQFRHITEGADQQTVVTFWVYPDSFPHFRQLRDHLYERGTEVAGRPLPEEAPISASRRGTASRGQ